MRAVSVSAGQKPASRAGSHSSVVVYVNSSPDDVAGVSTDEGVTRKEVAVFLLDPQLYRGEKSGSPSSR